MDGGEVEKYVRYERAAGSVGQLGCDPFREVGDVEVDVRSVHAAAETAD